MLQRRQSPKLNKVLLKHSAVLVAIGILLAAFLGSSWPDLLSAGYQEEELTTVVEIGGKPFGAFNTIRSLDDLAVSKNDAPGDYSVVRLNRDFVADASLYSWARATTADHRGLEDIHLVVKNAAGDQVNRYVLKLCRPLSWTIEASDPTLGGFHEEVEVAVQEIQVY